VNTAGGRGGGDREGGKARAKAEARPACTDDEEDTKNDLLKRDTSSSNISDATSFSEEVTSRERLRENDKAKLSKK
jgi:hypothetical protein